MQEAEQKWQALGMSQEGMPQGNNVNYLHRSFYIIDSTTEKPKNRWEVSQSGLYTQQMPKMSAFALLKLGVHWS